MANSSKVKDKPSIARAATPSSGRTNSWVTKLPVVATRLYFFIIILQIPLFRVPCMSGLCSSPIHVTSSQLIASNIVPAGVVKTLLYPGAAASFLLKNRSLPPWNDLFSIYNLTDTKQSSALVDLHRLEVLVGSYFAVSGAFVGLLNPGRMSTFGTLLIVWGLVKEGFLGKSESTDISKSVYMYPTMVLAVICALSSIKYDMKKLTKSPPARQIARPMQSSSRLKLG